MFTDDESLHEVSQRHRSETRNTKVPANDLSIGVLHLGIKAPALERAGFRTIGDLEGVDVDRIIRIPTVGQRTADLLFRNRKALLAASDTKFGTDWAQYCQEAGIPLLPKGCHPASGEEFLDCLPVFLAELAEQLSDETFAEILRGRICQPPGSQKTLEQIAEATSPPVTRERIRQKEKKLLSQLTGGLLNDAYAGLDIHFHPDFSRWWKIAADSLSDLEEIEFRDFVEVLANIWDVSHDAVMTHLPTILAIVTGEPQMSGEFRSASKISPKLFGSLSEEVRSLSILRLRLGRHAEKLVVAGINSVGDVVTLLRSGRLAGTSSTVAGKAIEHLNLLASCVSYDGEVDWESYQNELGLLSLPCAPVNDPGDFVNGLQATIEELLKACHITKRATDIYRRRTSRDIRSQMTLQAVADELRTHLPTVKREETVFLRFLNNTIIGHEFSSLPVWIDESWLSYWREAERIFGYSEKEFNNFSDNLAWEWRLTSQDIQKAAPTIWAVLTGYPEDRRSQNRSRLEPIVANQLPIIMEIPVGRVRLKGFRRAH